MEIQTCDQLWLKVQSLEQQVVPMKDWRKKDGFKAVSVDALGGIEEELLSVLDQIKNLACGTLKLDEKKFIEASRKFSDVIGCLSFLRKECKIVDYKELTPGKKVKKLFKELFGDYTYIPTKRDPIDVDKVQQDIRLSIRDMLMHQIPLCNIPSSKIEENVWGVERRGSFQDFAVKMWVCQKNKQPHVIDAVVSEIGISILRIPSRTYESWEDAAQGAIETMAVPGLFKSVALLKQNAEERLMGFVVKKDPPPGAFLDAWYVKKEGGTHFFVKGEAARPISFTVEGRVLIAGKTPRENIEEVFGESKRTCLAEIYKEEREKTLKKVHSKGIQGAYRDGKIYFFGGEKEVDLSEENNFGSVIVYDIDKPKICTLVCTRPGVPVNGKIFEIQEDGQLCPELDIDAIELGCFKKIFFLREQRIFERMVKKECEQGFVDVDGLRRCCMLRWCEEGRSGYRFVYKNPEKIITALVRNIVNCFFGSLNSVQPDGYAVEVFNWRDKLYYPLRFSDNDFSIDTFDGILSDISVAGISRKIEETWKAASLADIYREIAENKKKVHDAIRAIESIKIEVGKGEPIKDIETRFLIQEELYVLGEQEVLNSFDYLGCAWEYENGYVLSLREKGKTVYDHLYLDVRSSPGKIVFQYRDRTIEAPVEGFKEFLNVTFPKIAFPEVWDKKGREVQPFINAFRSVNQVKMTKETFFKNVRFLGENAEGALYVEVSDLGKVSLYSASSKTPKTINLLSAVRGGRLVVDGASYNTIEAFLLSYTSQKWKKLNEIEQLVVEKNVIISTYVSERVVNARFWASFEKKQTGRHLWEICLEKKNEGFFRSFFFRHQGSDMKEVFLRLSADGKKKIPLDFVLKEEKWKIRAGHKEFGSLQELLGACNLKAEDRYELVDLKKS